MPRGLRHIRTMRRLWDERRKGAPTTPQRPAIVRRLAPAHPASRRPPPKDAVAPRAWVFSKTPHSQARARPDRQLLVERTKEPQVDVLDEDEELIVLADLPGVAEQDVQIRVEGDLLIIEAFATGLPLATHYYTEAILPYEADERFSLSCNNGLIEARLRPKPRAAGRPTTRNDGERAPEAPKTGKTRRKGSGNRRPKPRGDPKRHP